MLTVKNAAQKKNAVPPVFKYVDLLFIFHSVPVSFPFWFKDKTTFDYEDISRTLIILHTAEETELR